MNFSIKFNSLRLLLFIHPCVLFPGMPTYPYLYADDLIDVLKKKHRLGSYKSLVCILLIQYSFSLISFSRMLQTDEDSSGILSGGL